MSLFIIILSHMLLVKHVFSAALLEAGEDSGRGQDSLETLRISARSAKGLLLALPPACGTLAYIEEDNGIHGGTLKRIAQLVQMTKTLGSPQRDYVILSEGNTSAKIDSRSFWVKASGSRMAHARSDGFLKVDTTKVLDLVDGPDLKEAEMGLRLAETKVDLEAPGSPSIETAMHALCLTTGGASFVGHTHPTAINAILCARDAASAFANSLFPAESLVCGTPVFVPYGGPGQALARAVRDSLETALRERGESPRALLLQNHGLVALGESPQQVLDITEMMVKTARILVQTYALGGPRFIDYR